MAIYDISGGTANLAAINVSEAKMVFQVFTDATYNGTTDTLTWEVSNDGKNWAPLLDAVGGSALSTTLSAVDLAVSVYTEVAHGLQIRPVFTAVNGTVGILTTTVGDQN